MLIKSSVQEVLFFTTAVVDRNRYEYFHFSVKIKKKGNDQELMFTPKPKGKEAHVQTD